MKKGDRIKIKNGVKPNWYDLSNRTGRITDIDGDEVYVRLDDDKKQYMVFANNIERTGK